MPKVVSYQKGNYVEIRERLESTNWTWEAEEVAVEQMWLEL